MSRTQHHSLHWGRDHRFAVRPERSWRKGGAGKAVGEAPGWHVRLYDHRPGRLADRALLHDIAKGTVDAEAAAFTRTGGRKPHTWYW